MGKHFALTFRLPAYRETQTRKPRLSADLYQYGLIIFSILVIMIFSYFYQVNSFSTKGYEIRRLQQQLATLKDQHRKLEIQAAELQSIQRIQSDQNVVSMIPVKSVNYIQTTSLTQR